MASLIKKTLELEGISNCEIVSYDNLTIEKAEELNCDCIIRGIRNHADYEYELEINDANRYLNTTIPTVFLPAVYNISSTMVRGLIENKFSIKRFVPALLRSIMNKIKVYHMDPYIHYGGFALIAAETADEANEMISDYKKYDPHNQSNSFGFCYVDELDCIYELSSCEKGIVYNRVYYSD